MKNNIYFIGAGGIGMANLVRYYLSKGCNVAGYDRTPSALTDALQSEGAHLVLDDDAQLIPQDFRDPDKTQVICRSTWPCPKVAFCQPIFMIFI